MPEACNVETAKEVGQDKKYKEAVDAYDKSCGKYTVSKGGKPTESGGKLPLSPEPFTLKE